LFSLFGFRSSVGWMCALRTASPDWHSFARWSWSEATAPSFEITCVKNKTTNHHLRTALFTSG